MTSDNEMDSMDIFLTKHAEEIREFWLAQYPQTKEEVPKHKFSWRFRWKMRRLMHEYDKRYIYKPSNVRRPLRVALLAACLVVVMSVSAVAASILWNVVIEEGENGTDIKITYSGEERNQDSLTECMISDFDVTYIPDGYSFNSKTFFLYEIIYEFKTDNGDAITITKMSPDVSNGTLDTEGTDITYETVNNHQAFVSENKDEKIVIIAWSDDEDMSYYEVISTGTTRGEAVKVAQNLKNIA